MIIKLDVPYRGNLFSVTCDKAESALQPVKIISIRDMHFYPGYTDLWGKTFEVKPNGQPANLQQFADADILLTIGAVFTINMALAS